MQRVRDLLTDPSLHHWWDRSVASLVTLFKSMVFSSVLKYVEAPQYTRRCEIALPLPYPNPYPTLPYPTLVVCAQRAQGESCPHCRH